MVATEHDSTTRILCELTSRDFAVLSTCREGVLATGSLDPIAALPEELERVFLDNYNFKDLVREYSMCIPHSNS
jgi:hypothetical protein